MEQAGDRVDHLLAIKEWLGDAYRENAPITLVCVYGIFILCAICAHLSIRHISKKTETMQPIPMAPVVPVTVDQKATDSTCSNISAGGSVNIDCPQTKVGHEKKK